MVTSLLITLREGIEAALIVGIVITYLTKINQSRYIKTCICGVMAAILASILTALLFEKILGGFTGRAEEIFEGIVMLIAVCVLSYMVIWMHHQAKYVATSIKHKIDTYTSKRQIYSLGFLCFIAVYREGVETVLFFTALRSMGTATSWLGGILGIVIAVLLAFIFFTSTRRFSLRHFFQITGIFLVLIAAGLFARGIHELQEARVIPVIKEEIFDVNPAITYEKTAELDLLIKNHNWQDKFLDRKYGSQELRLIEDMINNDGIYKSKRYKHYKNLVDQGYIRVSTPLALAFHERGSVGSFLKAIFGYNGNPSLVEFAGYILYYLSVLTFMRLSKHKMDQ